MAIKKSGNNMDINEVDKYIRIFNNHPHKDHALYIENQIEYSIIPSNYFDKIEFISNSDKYLVVFNILEGLNVISMYFYGKEKLNYHHLFEYIINFLGSNSYQLKVIINNIEIKDYKNILFETKKLEFNNYEIDENFIKIVNLYFNNLTEITFNNCTFSKNTILSKLKCNLKFNGCIIEQLNSLNFFNYDIALISTKILKYNTSLIKSKNIIINFTENELKNIMLFTSFPNLTSLQIIGDNCLKNSLNFISKSFPNLQTLIIDGIVYSLDFLYTITNLSKCEIISYNDSIGNHQIITPEIKNEYERNQIISKSSSKISSPLAERLAILEKISKILKSTNYVRYSQFEKNLYLDGSFDFEKLILDIYLDGEIKLNYNYDSNNYNLTIEANDDNKMLYEIFGSKLYINRKSRFISKYLSLKKEIVESSPFIYHANGTPIIFKKELSLIKMIEEAKKNEEDFMLDYIDYMNQLEDELEKSNEELEEDYGDFEPLSNYISDKQYYGISFYNKDNNVIESFSFYLDEFPSLDDYNIMKDQVEYALIYHVYINGFNIKTTNLLNLFSKNAQIIDEDYVRQISSGIVFYGKNHIFNNNKELVEFMNKVVEMFFEKINRKVFDYEVISKNLKKLINKDNVISNSNSKKYIKEKANN